MTADLLAAWLKAARRGDEGAFTRLVEATRERLFWTVRRMVGRDAVAEEILQEAYLALWDLPGSQLPRDVGAWLRRTCVNRAIDHVRRHETRKAQEDVTEIPLASTGAGPEEVLRAAEMEEVLDRALRDLPSQERAAFVLRLIEGLEYPEAASLLGVSESTVRNQVMQARRKVERALLAAGVEL